MRFKDIKISGYDPKQTCVVNEAKGEAHVVLQLSDTPRKEWVEIFNRLVSDSSASPTLNVMLTDGHLRLTTGIDTILEKVKLLQVIVDHANAAFREEYGPIIHLQTRLDEIMKKLPLRPW